MHVQEPLHPRATLRMLSHALTHGERVVAQEGLMDPNRGPVGTVTSFSESEYRFGLGTLHMRVVRVDWNRPVRYDDDTWYEVDGVELTADGRDIGKRHALVRARGLAALRARARP